MGTLHYIDLDAVEYLAVHCRENMETERKAPTLTTGRVYDVCMDDYANGCVDCGLLSMLTQREQSDLNYQQWLRESAWKSGAEF